MKIISYNVNGIRAAIKKGLIDFLNEEKPDVFLVQETKAQETQIEKQLFEDLGYKCHCFSAEKKGYSGVAVFSLIEPDKIVSGIGIEKFDKEGRTIRVDFGDLTVINSYFPSGTTGGVRQVYKMEYLDAFQKFTENLQKTRKNMVVSGDFNICHLDIDIHNPEKQHKTSGFLPEEREWVTNFLDSGFTDSFRMISMEPHNYSWWSYRVGARKRNKGWRIDYNMISDNLKEKITDAKILPDFFQSDHCPISVILDF